MPAAHSLLHPLLVRVVARCLHTIFMEHRHADKVIEQALRSNPKAGSRDRAFIAETTYEVLRYYRLYTEFLGREAKDEPDFWQLVGVHFALKNIELPHWQEFTSLQSEAFTTKIKEWQQDGSSWPRRVRDSIPNWLDDLGQAELPEQWDKTLSWLNRPAQVVLRANRLRTEPTELRQALLAEQIPTEHIPQSDALVLSVRKNVFRSAPFRKGWFEVQDYSSQLVAPLLAPEPGMRVVDACAGGGGKTLHLAALMQNRGSLIALDTQAWKLDELRNRARRAGATNIETRPIESRKTIKRLHGSADRLLLDVPCSGLGVLRRNPDAKWKLTAQQIEQLRATQQEILQAYSLITKPGGRMVYATCSILPSENQQQVERFLNSEAGKDFILLQERRILPQDEGFDGFFMALMERKA